MNVETAHQFLSKVSENKEFKQDFVQALNSDNEQQAKQAIFEISQNYGYQSSSDELWLAIENIGNEYQSILGNEELSEAELSAVAGGKGGNRTSAGIQAFGEIVGGILGIFRGGGDD